MCQPLRRILIALVFSGIFCDASAMAQDDHSSLEVRRPPAVLNKTSSISGRVTTPTGRPPDGPARITLRTARYTVSTSFTDKNGEFNFPNLVKDSYCLEVVGDKQFYKPTTECVQMEREPSLVQLTIYLKARDGGAEEKKNEKNGERVVAVADVDPQIPVEARQEYERALKLKEKGDTEEAIAAFKQAVTLYPRYQAAHHELGMLYRGLKQTDNAVMQFQAVLAVNERAFLSRLNLGITLVEANKFREAAEHLTLAQQLDSSHPQPHLYLGIAQLGTGELPAAYEELSKALILGDANYAVAHYYLAFVHLKRNERREAARELNEYLSTAPQSELADDARTLLAKLK